MWLMSQGQNEKALKVMENMANVNSKMPLFKDSLNKQTSDEKVLFSPIHLLQLLTYNK